MKKQWIVAAALLLLGLVYLLLRPKAAINYETDLHSGWHVEDITAISLEGEYRLVKQDEQWMIQQIQRPTDNGKMNSILTGIEQLVTLDLVSEAGNYTLYELEDSQARLLTVEEEGRSFELYLGKKSSSGGTYGRYPGQPGVYTFRGDWNSLLPGDVQELRSKTVLAFDMGQIDEVILSRGGESLNLDKRDEQWMKGDNPYQASQDLTAQIAGLSRLNCQSYVLALSGDVEMEIQLNGHWLKIYGKQDTGYLAESSQSHDPFLLSTYQAEGLLGLME